MWSHAHTQNSPETPNPCSIYKSTHSLCKTNLRVGYQQPYMHTKYQQLMLVENTVRKAGGQRAWEEDFLPTTQQWVTETQSAVNNNMHSVSTQMRRPVPICMACNWKDIIHETASAWLSSMLPEVGCWRAQETPPCNGKRGGWKSRWVVLALGYWESPAGLRPASSKDI